MPSGLALPHLLPRAAINLANVVPNREYPNQGPYRSQELQVSQSAGNVLTTFGGSYKDLQKYDQGAGLSVLLSHIFKIGLNAESRKDLTLDTKQVITYELDDSDGVFAALCEEVEFQMWLEKTVRKRDAYFVVGIQTLADAVIKIDSKTKKKAEGSAKLSTPQPGVDVEAAITAISDSTRGTEFVAQNEQIYAVQYRKILFEAFSRKDIDHASVSSNQTWKTYLKTRDGEEDDSSMVHVKLVDEGLEDEFDVISKQEGEIVFASRKTLQPLVET